jgi:hypothetical protein
MSDFYVPKYKSVTLRVEGNMVQMLQGGTLILEMPWMAAKELSRAFRFQAARAEQNEKINNVVMDQALLIRQGFPIALTKRPDVFKEAGKEAAWNSDIRKTRPGGIPEGVKFGYPAVFGRPRKGRIGTSGISSGETFGRIGSR